MKTLYLECGMGAAGDMLMAALLEVVPDREAFLREINALGIPGVEVQAEKAVKCGITGTHMRVRVHGEEEESLDEDGHGHHHHDHEHGDEHHHHDHEHGDEHHDHDHEDEHHHHDHDHGDEHHHHHASLGDIASLIQSLPVSESVRQDAMAVYAMIAEAESHVHGRPVEEIHFHEVGTMDAVTDVVGVCMLMEKIGADEVVASPVHTGSGYVRCAHGVLPVPAPATAYLLRDIPSYGGEIRGELCTPTGAALLRHFVTRFGERPVMTTRVVGYGMGMKEFERANCVRAFLGESAGTREDIVRLECNVDDMTGEDIGFAMERLMEAGARDVYTQSIGMKKTRPGILLSVLCTGEDADMLAEIMMKHTTTLGVRRQEMSRYVLDRVVRTQETPWGLVRIKKAAGMGVEKEKAEYEDLAALARAHGVSLETVRNIIRGMK